MTTPNVNLSDPLDGTSSTLLEKVRLADQEAWRRLVLLYGPLVNARCIKAGLQDADAADIAQNVFQSLQRMIGDFRPTKQTGSFRSWLVTIVKNKIRDHFREKEKLPSATGGSDAKRRNEEIPDGTDDGRSDENDVSETQLLLRSAVELILAKCKPQTREIFQRFVLQRQDAASVAADFSVSVNTVHLVKSRILKKVRDEFRELLD